MTANDDVVLELTITAWSGLSAPPQVVIPTDDVDVTDEPQAGTRPALRLIVTDEN